MTTQGYSFKASATTDYLAMAVIIFHMTIALGHTIWCLYFGTSSGFWDTIRETLTLAQNSRPANYVLASTGAGIKKGRTCSRKTRVRVTRLHGHDEQDHLVMIY